jgi:hypothetical protein
MTSTMRFDKWENTLGQPFGTVLQVIQVVDTAVTSFSGGATDTFFAYNNLNNTITPKGSNSKFLVRFQINASWNNTGGSIRAVLNLNGTPYGTTTSGTQRASSNSVYSSGSLPGSATIVGLTGEYLFQNSGLNNVSISFELFKQDGASVLAVNRSTIYDDTARGRPASWVTITEIAQ